MCDGQTDRMTDNTTTVCCGSAPWNNYFTITVGPLIKDTPIKDTIEFTSIQRILCGLKRLFLHTYNTFVTSKKYLLEKEVPMSFISRFHCIIVCNDHHHLLQNRTAAALFEKHGLLEDVLPSNG